MSVSKSVRGRRKMTAALPNLPSLEPLHVRPAEGGRGRRVRFRSLCTAHWFPRDAVRGRTGFTQWMLREHTGVYGYSARRESIRRSHSQLTSWGQGWKRELRDTIPH